ncbi:unnamed protein product [Diplocarpon coronariae]
MRRFRKRQGPDGSFCAVTKTSRSQSTPQPATATVTFTVTVTVTQTSSPAPADARQEEHVAASSTMHSWTGTELSSGASVLLRYVPAEIYDQGGEIWGLEGFAGFAASAGKVFGQPSKLLFSLFAATAFCSAIDSISLLYLGNGLVGSATTVGSDVLSRPPKASTRPTCERAEAGLPLFGGQEAPPRQNRAPPTLFIRSVAGVTGIGWSPRPSSSHPSCSLHLEETATGGEPGPEPGPEQTSRLTGGRAQDTANETLHTVRVENDLLRDPVPRNRSQLPPRSLAQAPAEVTGPDPTSDKGFVAEAPVRQTSNGLMMWNAAADVFSQADVPRKLCWLCSLVYPAPDGVEKAAHDCMSVFDTASPILHAAVPRKIPPVLMIGTVPMVYTGSWARKGNRIIRRVLDK